jgi:hypothetical protein
MSNRLLYALSAKGDVLLGVFDEMFGEIFKSGQVEEEMGILNKRREMVRAFDCLGHCEIDYNERRIYVCPPSFALLPTSGLPSGVLTGARSPKLMKKLRDIVRVEGDRARIREIPQRLRNMEMPSAIFVDVSNYEILKSIADKVGFQLQHNLPAAWDLADFSANIGDVAVKLKFEERNELNWPWRTFNPKTLFFDRDAFVSHNDVRFVCYTNPISQQRLHRLWQKEKAAEVDRDWGRYLFLSELGLRVLVYDERHFRLGVPSTVPLPPLIARALTLCSGLLPKTIGTKEKYGDVPAGHPMTVYAGVIPQMAALVGQKLKQNILNQIIGTDVKGSN